MKEDKGGLGFPTCKISVSTNTHTQCISYLIKISLVKISHFERDSFLLRWESYALDNFLSNVTDCWCLGNTDLYYLSFIMPS